VVSINSAEIVKKALQWRSERRTQVQSYVNQTELNLQYNSPLLRGIFIQRTTDLEKSANMNWLYITRFY